MDLLSFLLTSAQAAMKGLLNTCSSVLIAGRGDRELVFAVEEGSR